MTNPTFDTSIAAGRLRTLWSATADPQLAMSDDEVADVATVLAEHAAMAAELERMRDQQDGDVQAVAEACAGVVDGTPPQPVRHEYAVRRLRARFADRIAPLDTKETERKPIDIGTGMPATTHLEAFGQCLRDAFGAMPYHVGSSIHGKTWRDVDVRVMLDDDRFDALFPGYATWRQRDAWWSLLCSAISELGRQRTGLPIDFQVQRTTDANEKFPGARNPLFVGHAEEAHRPAMEITGLGRDVAARNAEVLMGSQAKEEI